MPKSTARKTGIFAPFEWMIAKRYLRAKRQESFISVISLFSLIGIALGVATLIIVMSVMNGFQGRTAAAASWACRAMSRFSPQTGTLADFDAIAQRLKSAPRRHPRRAHRGRAGDGQPERRQCAACWCMAYARPISPMSRCWSEKLSQGALRNFEGDESVIIGQGLANKLGAAAGRRHHADRATGQCHALRHHAAHQDLSRGGHLQDRQHAL